MRAFLRHTLLDCVYPILSPRLPLTPVLLVCLGGMGPCEDIYPNTVSPIWSPLCCPCGLPLAQPSPHPWVSWNAASKWVVSSAFPWDSHRSRVCPPRVLGTWVPLSPPNNRVLVRCPPAHSGLIVLDSWRGLVGQILH